MTTRPPVEELNDTLRLERTWNYGECESMVDWVRALEEALAELLECSLGPGLCIFCSGRNNVHDDKCEGVRAQALLAQRGNK